MRFLLDHDAPVDLEYSLRALGHEVIHLREVLPITAPDSDALDYAATHGLVMITCNRDDYLELAATLGHCGIIIVIRRKSRVAERAAWFNCSTRQGSGALLATSTSLKR